MYYSFSLYARNSRGKSTVKQIYFQICVEKKLEGLFTQTSRSSLFTKTLKNL